jgi:RNA polymerase sigma-70 factor (ECF subfamily)
VFFILAFLRRKSTDVPSGQVQASVTEGPGKLTALDVAMHRYADGDNTAFADVFAGLGPRLRLFLRRMGASPEAADDLTQETFLRIVAARGSFARGKPVAPWAYSIARNCFISHARSKKSKLARGSLNSDDLELPATDTPTAEEESMARQSADIVSRALASMTPARREAFVLLRYEGLSVAAAAQIVGISEGALKIRAFHAYEILRSALSGSDEAVPDTQSPARGTR